MKFKRLKAFLVTNASLKFESQHAKIQRNLMIQFQEKTRRDSRTEGRRDAIYTILPATAGGPTSTDAVDLRLQKIKKCKKSAKFINKFPENLALSSTTLYRFLATYQDLEKT